MKEPKRNRWRDVTDPRKQSEYKQLRKQREEEEGSVKLWKGGDRNQ